MDMNDGNRRPAKPARRKTATLPALFAAGLVLAATPALSQGAMGPGGGAMTPQPRVAPPPAPVAPPPQAPVLAPQMPIAAPSVNQSVPQPQTRSTTSSSNRDHIDQDAQTKKSGAPTGPAKPAAGKSEQVIPSVNVMVRKGAGPISSAKTDGNGQTTFRQLEPGTYDVALPSVPGGTVSMTTFVNGTPTARTDFPVGSSVGTFTVAKASDTVILKFQTNLGTTPVNGIGGTGGGRFQTDTGTTQTNGIGGTGGGRYTFK